MEYEVVMEEESPTTSGIELPADIDWEMLDKSKFFFLGAALFSGVSFALYPIVVLKTRLQISASSSSSLSSIRTAATILRHEGPRGFYRGFGTSLTGTIPARALYMAALEVTKSSVGSTAVRLGVSEPLAATIANGAAGLSAAVAAQVVWTPIDVISQRLMVQGGTGIGDSGMMTRYSGGIDACRKILVRDGLRGLYRGFGVSMLTYAPSNAVWWASYSISQRAIWGGIGSYFCSNNISNFPDSGGGGGGSSNSGIRPTGGMVVAVQGASAALAGGMSALMTMPLDTIKTRMQVLDGEERCDGIRRRSGMMTMATTVGNLLREGGWKACYRGLGPRWASMSMSASVMVTTYELLKRLSTKNDHGSLGSALV